MENWKRRIKNFQFSILNSFRGRLTGRTAGSEPVDKGSNPFPEANSQISERSTDGYMGLFWKQVFAGSNPAALTNLTSSWLLVSGFELITSFHARVAKMAKAPVLETGNWGFESLRVYQI